MVSCCCTEKMVSPHQTASAHVNQLVVHHGESQQQGLNLLQNAASAIASIVRLPSSCLTGFLRYATLSLFPHHALTGHILKSPFCQLTGPGPCIAFRTATVAAPGLGNQTFGAPHITGSSASFTAPTNPSQPMYDSHVTTVHYPCLFLQ